MLYKIFRSTVFLLVYTLSCFLGWLMAYHVGMDLFLSILLIQVVFLIASIIWDKEMTPLDFFFPSLILSSFLMLFSLMSEPFLGDIFLQKIHLAAGDYRKTYQTEKGDEELVLTGPTKNKVYILFQEKKWDARVRGTLIVLENGDQLKYYTENRPHPNKAGYGIKMESLSGGIEGETIHCFSEQIFEIDDSDIYPLEGI